MEQERERDQAELVDELVRVNEKAERDAADAQAFGSAVRNPVEHALCFLSAGVQSVLGALGRTVSRLTGT